jgi:hypothetical protein
MEADVFGFQFWKKKISRFKKQFKKQFKRKVI